MSKYKPYSKGKGNSRAGLQFDKLLKACNNSKKPPAAMAAGALGRFGVAQFTSARGGLDSTGEDDHQEKPSRFSSLNKRPRLDPGLQSLQAHPAPDLLRDSHIPINSLPMQTVMKPRKFFKSRGPMEVEVDPNQIRPLRPDISNLVPQQPLFTSNPILGSNQSNINNSTTHSSSYNNKKSTKGKKGDTLKKRNTSPTPNSTDNFNSVCSPPIKLKIIKDKVTSKFVSVSDNVNVHADTDIPSLLKSSPKGKKKDNKKGDKEQEMKIKRGRGRPPKEGKIPKPPKLEKQKITPPQPKRTSGRVTRSTIKYNEDDEDEDNDDSHSQPEELEMMSPPTEQENISRDRKSLSVETTRKLEEDAEFQKLSQMLSSMEEENGQSHGQQSQSQSGSQESDTCSSSLYSSQNNYAAQSFATHSQPQQVPSSYTDNSLKVQNSSNSKNTSFGGESDSDSSFSNSQSSHQYNNTNIQSNSTPYFPPGTSASTSSSTSMNYPPYSQSLPQTEIPVETKAQDIRSILEDDWNESFEEQDSPRKLLSQSPPKVSRFDASAFMPHHQKQQQNHQDERQDDCNKKERESNIQRPIPVYGTQLSNPPYNINSSPYAMKNLLSSGGEILNIPNPNNYASTASTSEIEIKPADEPQNLICHKVPNETSQQQQSSQDGHSSITSVVDIQPSTIVPTVQPKKASIFKSRAAKLSTEVAGSGSNGSEGKKRQAVYKHTFGQMDKNEEQQAMAAEAKAQEPTTLFGDYDEFGDEDDGDSDLKLRKLRIANSSSGGYSSSLMRNEDEDSGTNKVLCKKEAKKLFTVVRNVKAGHELQESGEVHEFDGDVWYILEDLKDKNPMNSRCLSAITLAGRCMDQSFRMHLRAHGTVAEFCTELHDAPQHPVLSLLAATVLFVLSQDRLNMDLDTESLKLILALTKSEPGNETEINENPENIKNRQRVAQLCLEMKNRGHAKHLNLEKITASELALETLLYLTSKRAGGWVMHELRTLGGLDSIVGEVDTSFKIVRADIEIDGAWTDVNMERLRKVDRCLKVLDQLTFNHEDNHRYLMQVSTRELDDGGRVKCTEASPIVFLEMFQFCKDILAQGRHTLSPECGTVIRDILFSVLRILVNLSHDYRGIVLGSEILLSIDGFLELSLHSTFEMTTYFPDDKVFDLLIYSLCLLLNLVECSKNNRSRILQSTIRKHPSGNFTVSSQQNSFSESDDSGVEEEVPVLDALIQMFLAKERSAKKEEQYTDNILTTGNDQRSQSSGSSGAGTSTTSKDKDSQDQEGSSMQDTIDNLLKTAGKHMENSILAAYISLLIGYMIMDDQVSVKHVRDSMPDRKFLPLMVVLKKLFNFMSITSSASGSTRGLKATSVALTFYGKADPASDEELKKIIPD